jgi:hypothetical protein
MRIEDIEILNTLNEIQKVNDMLVFHQNQPNYSKMSVENYLVMREDLLAQLNELLKSYHLTFTWNDVKIAA